MLGLMPTESRWKRTITRIVLLAVVLFLAFRLFHPFIAYENFLENPGFRTPAEETFPPGWHFLQPYGSDAPFVRGAIQANAAGVHRYYQVFALPEPGAYEITCTYLTQLNGSWPLSLRIRREDGELLTEIPLGEASSITTLTTTIQVSAAGSYKLSLGTYNQGMNGTVLFRYVEVKPRGSQSLTDIAGVAGDLPAIERVLDRVALRLGQALAGLVAAIDPHTLVIGTSDKRFSELLKPPLERHLYNELIALHARDAEVRTTDDVVTMSLKGAAAAVIDTAFGEEILPA